MSKINDFQSGGQSATPHWCSHIKWMECGMTGWHFNMEQLPPSLPDQKYWFYIGNTFSVCPICEKKRPVDNNDPHPIVTTLFKELTVLLEQSKWLR